MGKVSLPLLLILLTFAASAQNNLSGSRQSSVYTYIYRLSVKETGKLYRSNMEKLQEKYLHSLTDSFPSKADTPLLKPGNYLFVKAVQNKLEAELRTIDDLQIRHLLNNRDLLITVYNKQGKPVNGVQVLAGNKRIPWDDSMQLYRLEKKRRPALVTVLHDGVIHYYPLERSRPLTVWQKIIWSFPVRYIAMPVRRLIKGQYRPSRYGNYFYNPIPHEKEFTGFMAFSKPMYKPGDTVKLKAWVMNKAGKPFNKPLLLRLTSRGFETDTILATIRPYRPGGFEYHFVLKDSLDLRLDEEQLLTLEEEGSRKYDLSAYDGDLSDGDYAKKRLVVMRGKFSYEDYELQSITFHARSDKKEHNRGNPVAIYCKAIDENELSVMDGRVEVLVKPVAYKGIQFKNARVFLPDTLWHFTRDLETIGETKIILPDSLFPAASFAYEVICNFRNSNNEFKTAVLQQQFYNDQRVIVFKEQGDSLHIEVSEAGRSLLTEGTITAFTQQDDTVFSKTIKLPATIPYDPFVAYYEAEADSLWEEFIPENQTGAITCSSVRTKDSVTLLVNNPARLHFWYTIYAGSKLIRRGYTDSLFFTEKTQTEKNYFISLQYIFANQAKQENYSIPFKGKQLNIQVNQPQQVYPGQEVKVDIAVTDKDGLPVGNADVTAWSYTKKFRHANPPVVPYLGKIYKGRRWYNNFIHEPKDLDEGTLRLNWQRWSKEMGLDSIEYYRFLHPDSINVNTEPVSDSTTQFAPFVVIKGDLQPIHLLYVDEQPCFFSQAQHLRQYSFAISPGKHNIKIRTHNQLITLNGVMMQEGVKTFIAINADTSNKKLRAVKTPDTLTNYEKELWSKYMILVENTFGERMAVINQNSQYKILNLVPPASINRSSPILTGPLSPSGAMLYVRDRFAQSFNPEGNYLFNISQGLIKQKQWPFGRYAFEKYLSHQWAHYSFKEYVLTAKAVDSLWQNYLDNRNASQDLFRYTALKPMGNGQLRIGTPQGTAGKDLYVTAVFLFRYDDPDFARIYKGNSTDLGYMQPGMYRILYLLTGNQYHIQDSVAVKQDGINYYHPGTIMPRYPDSTSRRLESILNGRESGWRSDFRNEDMDAVKLTFNDRYFEPSANTRFIYGKVTDLRTGDPLPGAAISIKGTNIIRATDAKGNYEMNVPERATIQVAYIGYTTLQKKLGEGNQYDFQLEASQQSLNEVVVVGYGTTRKRSVTGSVSTVSAMEISTTLEGRAAGIMIRGLSSIAGDAAPLYIVDGVPYSGTYNADPALIADISILKDAAATAIYGSRAGNGVVIITTKKKAAADAVAAQELPFAGNTLRKNFRDDAYWQPNLRTNEQGLVSFVTRYPDDITSWRTFVVAIADKKRTGQVDGHVRSFKALSASLAVPQFAITGDTIQVIGKTMNYSLDSMTLQRAFLFNDAIASEAVIGVRNAHIDSFNVAIAAKDSARFKYTIQKEDGYFDGEERSIPVFKQGTVETKGFFTILDKDSNFTIQPDVSLGNMTLHAETNVLPVLLDEIESLRQYEYYCNEQLASKLKALLLKKKIYAYLKKEFKEEKDIRELISRLNQNKTDGLLWGWWKGNSVSIWISLHVAEALLVAEQQGYTPSFNKQAVTDFLVYHFDRYSIADKALCIRLWRLLKAKVDYRMYIEAIETRTTNPTLYEKLAVVELKEQEGMPVSIDTFISKHHSTVMGNIYWGEEGYYFFNNSIPITLAMYRILKLDGHYEDLLKRIRYYFLEKRKDGKWRNTYESALILETILPDLLTSEDAQHMPSFTITTAQPATVTSFPYTATFASSEKITITGRKGMPVYFTAYQKGWNPTPLAIDGNFTVASTFERNEQIKSKLTAGEAVILKVKVSVKADADYVMVEVPIPAGCSYQDKAPGYQNNEVHREHFKNKVSIFCSTLSKGTYTFTVSLMPRYSGKYHLNPAKAEMMYFPVFYGREGMKKISIE